MAEANANLLRLMTWLSPAFPVGAFAYSHGLEHAIHDGVIRDRATLIGWLGDLLEAGSAWNDAVLLTEAWRKADSGEDWREVAELAEAMAGSRERHMETVLQGRAFLEAMEVWAGVRRPRSTLPPSVLPDISPTRGEITQVFRPSPIADIAVGEPSAKLPISPLMGEMSGRTEGGNVERGVRETDHQPVSYPIAVGVIAARHGVPLTDTLTAYLHAFASNLIQAAVRLVPLGQRDGVATLAGLEPAILAIAQRASESSLDDLGAYTILSDVMSMKHETQYSRVFRS